MASIPSIDVDQLASNLRARKNMTAKERKADNNRLKALRDSYPKTSRGKTIQVHPWECCHCGTILNTEKALDAHRDEVQHPRYRLCLGDGL